MHDQEPTSAMSDPSATATAEPESLPAIPIQGPGWRLTDLQQRFLDAWLGPARYNAALAARMAGYDGPNDRIRGHQLLTSLNVQTALLHMGIARGIARPDLEGLLRSIAYQDRSYFARLEACETRAQVKAELRRLGRRGLAHLVKRVHWTKAGPSIEYYDKETAIFRLGQLIGAWKDTVHLDLSDLDNMSPEQLKAIADGKPLP